MPRRLRRSQPSNFRIYEDFCLGRLKPKTIQELIDMGPDIPILVREFLVNNTVVTLTEIVLINQMMIL